MTKLEKEIYDQKTELKVVFDFVTKSSLDLSSFLAAKSIYFVGCGSSYYLAISAAKHFSRQLAKFTKAIPGGEVAFHFAENIPEKVDTSLAVMISRSGDSTEMVLAAQNLKKKGFQTFCVTLNPESKLLENCNDALVLPVEEESVVMTKSFSSMLLSLLIIADLVSKTNLDHYQSIFNNIDYFFFDPSYLDLSKFKHLVFLGSGIYEGIARESSLKVEEMSLTQAEAFSAFEYRHGPKALVTEETLIVIFSNGTKEERRLAEEVKAYGAQVIERISIDGFGRDAFAHVIFSQLMGVHLAKLKGVDPQKPRNLTRVVEFNL